MSNREFTAHRTMLANAFATAGAELLEYMGVGAALAAIPNTEPQQYVVAGTLQMIAKVLPAAEVIKPAAAEKPTGDLTDEQIWGAVQGIYLSDYQDNLELYDIAIARAAIAAYLERQAQQAEPVAWMHEDGRVITAATMTGARKDGGAMLSSLRGYTIPLYAAPASQEGAHAALDEVRPQWISVDERLPEPETDVLIIRLNQIRVGAIFIEHESWEEGGSEIHYWDDPNDDGQGWDWGEVTHWMPLPAAPDLKTPASAERSGDGCLGDNDVDGDAAVAAYHGL